MTKEQPNNKQLLTLAAAVLVPVYATAHLLRFWLSKPLAQAISIFVWLFAVYWIPPKPKMRPWVWLIVAVSIASAVLFLTAADLDPF
jgi:hypothetical protein